MKIKLIAISILLGASLSAQAGFVSVKLNDMDGGHISKHLKVTVTVAKKYLSTPRKVGTVLTLINYPHAISSFKSSVAANKLIAATITQRQGSISKFVKTKNYREFQTMGFASSKFELPTGKVWHTRNGGRVINTFKDAKGRTRSIREVPTSYVCVVIKKRFNNIGWLVQTAYPVSHPNVCATQQP